MKNENILDEIHDFISEFVAYPNDHSKTVITLWAVHTHLMEAFYYTPRLHITSATSGCGKTTLLNLANLLVHKPMPILNPSPASLYTLIDQEHPTLLIDEIDTLFAKKDTFDITSIVNSGFDRSSQGVPRVSIEPRRVDFFNVFGPVLLSGIDKSNMPDTIENRCIQIRLRRKLPGETVKAYRPHKHKPQGDALRERLEKFISDNDLLQRVKEIDPKIPERLENRNADKWMPLFAVADAVDVADASGMSDWGKRAREAALFFLSEEKDLEPTDYSELILRDIYDVFDEPKIKTASLLESLWSINEAPWNSYLYGKPLDGKALAKLLKPHGIKPKAIRFGSETDRGYYKSEFEDAWRRYIKTAPQTHTEIRVTPITDATRVTLMPTPFSGDTVLESILNS